MSATARFCYLAGLALYALVFFKNAWVGDDAYILFRSLEQLLDGHGPRWNPHERVQVFTCPLWYWLLAAMGAVYRNHYLNSLLLSAACNAALLWNLHKILPKPSAWLLAILTLAFSQAYFDFTSSGLENPLAYCLLSFVVRFYCNREQLPSDKALLYGATAAGLLLVTRHDLLLFVLPLIAHGAWQSRQQSLSAPFTALLLPLATWTLFALLYYGFPFPNTAYAKLAAVVPREQLVERGLIYFRTSILRDFISIFLLPAGVLAGLCSRDVKSRFIAGGILLHLAYVVWIGGDFMRGRFFGWDVLLCAVLLFYPLTGDYSALRWRVTTSLAACAAAISTWLWEPPIVTPAHWGAEPFKVGDTADNVTQERFFFYWFTAFWKSLVRDTPLLSDHGWCHDGLQQREQGVPVASSRTVGMHGFCLGTNHIVIDVLGITDPLLARMPRNPSQQNWRPGHFLRLMPEGYCSSVLHGDNRIADPETAAYYNALRLLTQGEPLLSAARLRAIWEMNTGRWQTRLEEIHNRLTNNFSKPDGPAQQQEAMRDCPAVQLPPELIEQLRKAGQ